jgi:hypothetical protein
MDTAMDQAGVSEWQTRQTQNLLAATSYGFKSRHRQSLSGFFLKKEETGLLCFGNLKV